MSKVKMGDICDFYNGGAWSDKEYVTSGLPVLKVSNCKNSGFQIEEVIFLPVGSKEKYAKNKLYKGDVIIATVGSHPNLIESAAGRSYVVNSLVEGFYLNQNAVCLRTKDKEILNQEYLGYLCKEKSFQHFIQNKGRGAASQMRIAIGGIKEYEFNLPDIDIQRRISAILIAYDGLIENNQKQIKLLEEAAQRIYKEWFVDLHFPGYEDVKIVDGLPEGWQKVSLTEIAPIVTGKKDANFGTENGPYMFFTCAQEPIKAPSYSFDCDAVILAGNGDFNVKLFRGQFEAYQRTYVFSPYDSNNLYLLYYAVKDNMRQLFQGASGSTIKFLTKRMLEEIMIHIPDENTLETFTKYCESYQKKIEILNKQITVAKEARDRLFPKLMSGEIEV